MIKCSLTTALIALLILCLLASLSYAARLPSIGGDDDIWGWLLVDFINTSFNESGWLRSNTVDYFNLRSSSVNTTNIIAGAITGNLIASDSINASHVSDNAITSSKIANSSVSSSKLQDDAVVNRNIIDRAVSSRNINTSAVNTTHILDSTVTGIDVNPGSLNSSHIQDGTITSADIAQGTINGSHVLDGSLTGSDVFLGSNLTVLSVNASFFGIGPDVETAECTGMGCDATATCEPGMRILMGFSATNAATCDNNPGTCNSYCTPGDTVCTATAGLTGASVYIICARIT